MAEYFDREALLLRIDCHGTNKFGMLDEDIRAFVKAQPAADVAPVVHGRWEQDADGDWYCTNCDEVVAICESGRERTYRKLYCPNCGAKMDGGVDDEADGNA
nr:MAG TPA: Transcription initiation factor IIE, alpha FINGER, Transcription [Caudoviricetes sp.]